MSLRIKVILILLLSGLTGVGAMLGIWQPWSLQKELDDYRIETRNHLVTVGDAMTPFLLQNQIAAIHETLDATLERQPNWRSLELYDDSGALLYPLVLTPVAAKQEIEKIQHLVQLRNTTIARLVLVLDTTPLRSAQRRQAEIIASLFLFGFALSGVLIGFFLHLVVGKRTHALAAAAEQFGRGELDAPLPKSSPDEIGRLIDAFDQMRHNISAKNEDLIAARLAAESANHAKSAFLATMSHEIRTPMNGILGMAELLMMPDTSEHEREEYSRIVLNSGKTLMALLNDILDLSKIEAHGITLEHVAFEPDELMQEIATLFAEAAKTKNLSLQVAGLGNDQRYRGDPIRLRQMLTNLVSNAIKFSKQGEIRIEAEVMAIASGKAQLTFSVKDNGIGVAADQLPLLFQPFTQADSSITRLYGGTGLGLSIVRGLANRMEGETGAESTPGQGSRFWFRVNLDAEKEFEAGHKQTPDTTSAA